MSSRTKSSEAKLSEPLLKIVRAHAKKALADSSKATGIPVASILSGERYYPVTFARHLAYWLASERTGFPDGMVAKGFGIDRTCLSWGKKSIAAARETDPKLRFVIERAETIASRKNGARP